ncbi:hypothetical protein DPMN_031799 [Dreissena polymorpha]|uniref:Uncharacterized protein n=1 Tax=Dreissena polymorpha TaxID=45954 RepID=A0A9D4RIC6_DREPO|nr:hypothetical protein DPMN_031799 [Dreissena polymorpha]
MFGGLHIEIAALRTIGDWLQDSGWVNALCQSNVASAGTADSFLMSSHVTRTRHAFSSMPLVAETNCRPFLIVERRLHGKHGPSLMR